MACFHFWCTFNSFFILKSQSRAPKSCKILHHFKSYHGFTIGIFTVIGNPMGYPIGFPMSHWISNGTLEFQWNIIHWNSNGTLEFQWNIIHWNSNGYVLSVPLEIWWVVKILAIRFPVDERQIIAVWAQLELSSIFFRAELGQAWILNEPMTSTARVGFLSELSSIK